MELKIQEQSDTLTRVALNGRLDTIGVERVESERGLSRARQPRDDDQPVARQIDVQVLQVVRACAADADVFHRPAVSETKPATIRNSVVLPLHP